MIIAHIILRKDKRHFTRRQKNFSCAHIAILIYLGQIINIYHYIALIIHALGDLIKFIYGGHYLIVICSLVISVKGLGGICDQGVIKHMCHLINRPGYTGIFFLLIYLHCMLESAVGLIVRAFLQNLDRLVIIILLAVKLSSFVYLFRFFGHCLLIILRNRSLLHLCRSLFCFLCFFFFRLFCFLCILCSLFFLFFFITCCQLGNFHLLLLKKCLELISVKSHANTYGCHCGNNDPACNTMVPPFSLLTSAALLSGSFPLFIGFIIIFISFITVFTSFIAVFISFITIFTSFIIIFHRYILFFFQKSLLCFNRIRLHFAHSFLLYPYK